MKILLLSDILPCENLTAGLVLSAMVRFVPRDEICCFIVANPVLDMQLSPEFSNIPTEVHAKPNENWAWLPRQRFVSKLSAAACLTSEFIIEQTIVRALIRKAVSFGRDQKVDRVWAVLQGQTTIRMAHAVADQLGVPLHTHVWDPFSWWARANCLDRITSRRVQALFDGAIRQSKFVATASEPMAALYREQFGVSATPVIASHAKSMAQTSQIPCSENLPLVIGMAGQFYAASEWLQLLHALRASHWKVAGRSVRIVVMGPQCPPGEIDDHVSFLGWKSQQDAAFILSNCDVLYCPYPFDQGMKDVSQFSFPSKLVLYLAAGRPILFHGPEYSSPAQYIRSHKCGLVANRLFATAVYNEIERLALMNFNEYRDVAASARTAFLNEFTLESMGKSFGMFIGNATTEERTDIKHNHVHCSQDRDFSHVGLSDAKRNRSIVRIVLVVARTARVFFSTARQKIRSFVRWLALKIPRLQSLYHEILALYSSNALLKEEIANLKCENERLNTLLFDEPWIENSDVVRGALSGEVVTHFSSNIAPNFVSDLHPDVKILVLTQSVPELEATVGLETTGLNVLSKPYLTIGTVAYAQLAHPSSNIGWETDWPNVRKHLPSRVVSSVLRLVIQEGYRRIVVAGDVPNVVALAAEVSRLSSVRLTVITSQKNQPIEWLAGKDHIDFVGSASKNSMQELMTHNLRKSYPPAGI